MKFSTIEKKQLLIYALIAYGITYLMGILMWYGYAKGLDNSAFPNAQMMYPAAGVMMAYLATKKGDTLLPKAFYRFFIVMTALMIICAVLSVLMPNSMEAVAGVSLSVWALILQVIMIFGSVLFWILLLNSGKERRTAYGLKGNKWKSSVLCILLFVGLYFLRTGVGSALGGQWPDFTALFTSPFTWLMLCLSLPINFFLVVAPFFGEEYGWRYFLQPLLQKRFGLRSGVLVLGVVWGLWHLPVNFFYYTTPDMGLQSCAAQQITCISLGIFMAYTYMKTENIWVPVMIHYLNNNLITVLAGSTDPSVIANQTITWGDLLPALLLNGIIFGVFILSKEFRKEKTVSETTDNFETFV